jgi:hypothetical protein
VRTALAVLVVACLWPRTVHAGRSFYGWLYGTEVMPERGVELQTWILEEDSKYATNDQTSSIWWGPLIGITDQLELALPVELNWERSDVEKVSFTFKRFGIEARYRLVAQDPVEAPPLVPLVRLAVKRDVTQRDDVRVEADVVTSYEVGAVHALVDLGFVGDITPHTHHAEMRPGGGVSVQVTGELRVGAEAYAELSLDSLGESWAAVGPNVAWTHGRFWLSGAFGIGVYHINAAPRVMFGIAF